MLDRLEMMLAAMTPSEWVDRPMGNMPRLAGPTGANGKRPIAVLFPVMAEYEVNRANADGLIALRNLAPLLLAELRAGRAVQDSEFSSRPADIRAASEAYAEAVAATDAALTKALPHA